MGLPPEMRNGYHSAMFFLNWTNHTLDGRDTLQSFNPPFFFPMRPTVYRLQTLTECSHAAPVSAFRGSDTRLIRRSPEIWMRKKILAPRLELRAEGLWT